MADVQMHEQGIHDRATSGRSRWLGLAMIALGLGVASSAVLGPLVLGAIDYHASSGAIVQVKGSDLVSLLLVAPVSVLAGLLTLRGHLAGPVIGIGPAVFAVYTYTQLSVGGDFARYEGNSESFFLLNLGLFVFGGVVAIGSWSAIDPVALVGTTVRFDRFLAGFLLASALFLVVGLHAPHLVAIWNGSPTEEYLADPGVFWMVKLMDLGIIVPAMVGVAIGLLLHKEWAHKAKFAVVGWFALLGSSVAGMAIIMQITAAPGASTAFVLGFGIIAVVGLILAISLYRPLFRSR